MQAIPILSALIVATTGQGDVSGLEVNFTSALLAQTPPDGSGAPPEPQSTFGQKNSWRWMVQGGVGFEVSESSNGLGLLGGGMAFEGSMLITANEDRPGMIAGISQALAARQINISNLSLGRDATGGTAVSLWNLDGTVDEAVAADIEAVDGVLWAKTVRVG